MSWTNDEELFSLIKRNLFTAVIGDIMDKLGFFCQFLPPYFSPLDPLMLIAGRAMPVLEADISEDISRFENAGIEKPFGLMFEALDDLRRNEVYICTGASPDYALWGELMSTRAIKLGAAGAILDGYTRDTREILKMNFPVFSRGRFAQDQLPRGRVVDFRKPIRIGQATIRDGDILVGDIDGICVIPKELEMEVFLRALEKVRCEKTVRQKIAEGMSTVEAFEKYGIM